jgi:hypothetical protein
MVRPTLRWCVVLLTFSGSALRLNAQSDSPFRTRSTTSESAVSAVPFDAMPGPTRDLVRRIIARPTLVTHAPVEEFVANPETYAWLVEHPDRAADIWQKLGVPCAPILDQGNGRFSWADGQGSEISWVTATENPRLRVWVADGHVKPSSLLAPIPVKAVAILRHVAKMNSDGTVRVRHQVDVFVHADSRAANVVAKLLGPTAERMAEQGANQLLAFFSNPARYLTRNPKQAETILGVRFLTMNP